MQDLKTEYSVDEDSVQQETSDADDSRPGTNIQHDLEDNHGSNLKQLLDKLDAQTGISMPESTFLRDDTHGFRELNADFAISRVEEGPSCCPQSTLFDRVPTQLLAFSFMIFIGILGMFECWFGCSHF
jgi:hypothetical protein